MCRCDENKLFISTLLSHFEGVGKRDEKEDTEKKTEVINEEYRRRKVSKH